MDDRNMINAAGLLFLNNLKIIKENRRRNIRRCLGNFKSTRKLLMIKYIQDDETQENEMIFSLLNTKTPVERSIWMKPRDETTWKIFKECDNRRWKEAFRVNKSTFLFLCNELEKYLQPKHNSITVREPVPVDKQIAITLYTLASCCEYRVVGDVFGVHKSTVHTIFYRVLNCIVDNLGKVFLRFPDAERAKEIASSFKNKCGLPMIIGCIDGCHIPILAPTDGHADFLNRKGWTSIILQGVVDHKYRFIDASIKFPGRCHDAHAFKGSGLYKLKGQIFPNVTENINGRDIGPYLIGDPAYPLLSWVLKDYPGRNISTEQQIFNKALNRARVNIEIAFGRLKSRFRILCKRVDLNHRIVPKLVATCCVLHNIIEDLNDQIPRSWMNEVTKSNQIFAPVNMSNQNRDDPIGSDIRDHLCEFLNQNIS